MNDNKEIILAITEIENYVFTKDKKKEFPNRFTGYSVITSKQTILILINNQSQCCENFGYMSSEDNFEDFIESELKELKAVDTSLSISELNDIVGGHEEPHTMFVNLETNKGTLQFTLYNEHNGFYGHKVRIVSHQLNIDEEL